MLQARTAIRCRAFLSRSYASASSPHALVFLEHNSGGITSGSLSALTAATKLGGEVTGILVGGPEQVPNAVEKAKTYGHRNSFPVNRLTRNLVSRASVQSYIQHPSNTLSCSLKHLVPYLRSCFQALRPLHT